MMLFNTIYVGYFTEWGRSIVMCISDNVDVVIGYLRRIRHLSKRQIEIDEVTLDEATMIALYEDYIIEEYIDGIYLTRRDIARLDSEVQSQMKEFVNTYQNLAYFRDILASTDDKLAKDSAIFDPAIAQMQKRLTSAKSLQKIQHQLIYSSDVLTKDIGAYIRLMGAITEDNEMRELFLQKLNDPFS